MWLYLNKKLVHFTVFFLLMLQWYAKQYANKNTKCIERKYFKQWMLVSTLTSFTCFLVTFLLV